MNPEGGKVVSPGTTTASNIAQQDPKLIGDILKSSYEELVAKTCCLSLIRCHRLIVRRRWTSGGLFVGEAEARIFRIPPYDAASDTSWAPWETTPV